MLELAIVENVQRVELNPIEEAEAYQRLIEDCGLTQEEVAEKISKDRTSVTNFIRLLKLPEPIKDSIRMGELGMGHAKAILSIADRTKQSELWSEAVRERYSVRKLEELARAFNNPEQPAAKPLKRPIAIDANGASANGHETSSDIRAIESGFRQVLGTQVKVRVKADGSGEIVIQFFSLDEFERLRELLTTIAT
jgi:ParB family chromosome partitioning protein